MKSDFNKPLILNLNTYSHYSLLSSALSIDEIILFAKNNNQKYVALSDTNLYGAIEFYNKSTENNLIPILGLDIIYKTHNIVLFIKNNVGYKNLVKISSYIKTNREFDLNDLLEGIFIVNKSKDNINFLKCDIFSTNQNNENRIACNESRYFTKEDNIILSTIKRIQANMPINDLKELEDDCDLSLIHEDIFLKNFDSIAIQNLNNVIININ